MIGFPEIFLIVLGVMVLREVYLTFKFIRSLDKKKKNRRLIRTMPEIPKML